MTEAVWQVGADPALMLKAVRARRRERKLRLFCCACCRRLWDALPAEGRQAVEVAERFADGRASAVEKADAHGGANVSVLAPPRVWSYGVVQQRYAVSAAAGCSSRAAATTAGAIAVMEAAADAVALAAADPPVVGHSPSRDVARALETAAQADLLRDMFGNPFRPVTLSPSWLTSDVLALARHIYADRTFDQLPILADALLDAGCENPDVLGHCTGPGPHVRGCWVVDLLLGKG